MAKFQSPLLGYNNNVRHRGRVFHIQTEDSGVNHPHVITHIFMDGGRILKSVKKSYAEHVGSDTMSETVRVLMKEQHKAMFVALRDGQFDELAFGPTKPSGALAVPAGATSPKADAPAAATAPSSPKADAPAAVTTPPSPKADAAATAPSSPKADAAAAAPPSPKAPAPNARVTPTAPAVVRPTAVESTEVVIGTMPVVPLVTVSGDPFGGAAEPPRAVAPAYPPAEPPLPPELEALLRDELSPPAPAARAEDEDAPQTMREPARRRSAQELTLDFDALERDAGPSPIFQRSDLPPPPKNLFAKEPRTGTYSAVEAEARQEELGQPPSHSQTPARTPQQPPARSSPPTPRGTPSQRPPSEGRAATARPAAIFGAVPAGKHQAPTSIFSDDLVSDKSLDEVILSYLAEDLDPPRRK